MDPKVMRQSGYLEGIYSNIFQIICVLFQLL
jgi:hypothetical protein